MQKVELNRFYLLYCLFYWKKISLNICDYLISKGCIIIIIACNTASAISLEYLRLKYKDIIFIAIEPAIKLAYLNKDGPTLIMATEATLNSKKARIFKQNNNLC